LSDRNSVEFDVAAELRTTHIAPRQTRPRNVKLTAHASRDRLKTTAQNVGVQIGDSPPDKIAGARSGKLAIEK
jgi:hypothetical protein